jgi:hypothetical protein
MRQMRTVAALLAGSALSLSLTACGVDYDPMGMFETELETLGYEVIEVKTETESGKSVIEARVAISDETDPDCYVELEQTYNETKTTNVDGHEVEVFTLDEAEDKNGKEADVSSLSSPTPEDVLAHLEESGDFSFCVKA